MTDLRPYKLCCITYKRLDSLVRQAIRDNDDPEIDAVIVDGLQDAILDGLAKAEAGGCEVAIAGGANARIARDFSTIPVIEYRLSAFDIINAVEEALSMGGTIAVCTYRIPIESALQTILLRRDAAFVNIIYEADDDLRASILRHPDSVVVGAAHAVDIAQSLGYRNVLIYPGKEAVLAALRDAKALAEQLRRQDEYRRFSRTVIENSGEGLALVDAAGVVIEINPAAAALFGVSPTQVKGKPATETLSEVGYSHFKNQDAVDYSQSVRTNGNDLACRWLRLADHSRDMGAIGFFTPLSEAAAAQSADRDRRARDQSERGFRAKSHFRDIIGSSSAMKRAKTEAALFARSDAALFIHGETGAGKEIFAQGIHNAGARRHGPFIAVNCAALPGNLLESELFGYDEGAFTGGKKGGKKGLFELANGGSIFLDEIGELPPMLQSRLLRVLQEREIMRVGGDRVISVDVRVISASNRNLEREDAPLFRRDLYYRLSVLELVVPPLRDRDADVLDLFAAFLARKSSLDLRLGRLPEPAARILRQYRWPGNTRELQNVCERFALYFENATDRSEKSLRRSLVRAIGEERLLADILSAHGHPDKEAGQELIAVLQDLLGYNKSRAAEVLGMSRTTLWRRER